MRSHLRNAMRFAAFLATFSFLAGCGQSASQSVQPAPIDAKNPLGPATITGTAPDELSKTIVLPHDEPLFPAGPGADAFLASCALCHSTRYISMQPTFTRTVWTAEVQKMVKTFGAPVPEAQASQIVDYLVYYQEKNHLTPH